MSEKVREREELVVWGDDEKSDEKRVDEPEWRPIPFNIKLYSCKL